MHMYHILLESRQSRIFISEIILVLSHTSTHLCGELICKRTWKQNAYTYASTLPALKKAIPPLWFGQKFGWEIESGSFCHRLV